MTDRMDTGDRLEALDPGLRLLVDDTRSRDDDDPAFGPEVSRRVLDRVRGTIEELDTAPTPTGRIWGSVALASVCVVAALAGSKTFRGDGEPTSTVQTATTSARSDPSSVADRAAPSSDISMNQPLTATPGSAPDRGRGVPSLHVHELPRRASAAPGAPSAPPSSGAASVRSAPPKRGALAGTDLAEEYRLIEGGRAGLAAGDHAGALRSLREHAERFPNGQLSQECESLHIEVLVSAGRIAEARERARRFQERFPSGLLMPSVARAIASTSGAKP